MRTISLMFSAAALMLTTGIAAADSCVVNDPTGTPLNVRKGPSSSAAILGALNNGTVVSTGTTSGDWMRVAPHEAPGKSGWVYRKYLECPDPPARRVKLPPEMLGTWCPVKTPDKASMVYERRNCLGESDNWIVIGPDGYKGHETWCTTMKATAIRDGGSIVYSVLYRCRGEGDERDTWATRRNMFLGEYGSSNEGKLVVRYFELTAPKEEKRVPTAEPNDDMYLALREFTCGPFRGMVWKQLNGNGAYVRVYDTTPEDNKRFTVIDGELSLDGKKCNLGSGAKEDR